LSKGIAASDGAQQDRQNGTAAVGAGGVFLEDVDAACGMELITLRIRALIVGGHARIAD